MARLVYEHIADTYLGNSVKRDDPKRSVPKAKQKTRVNYWAALSVLSLTAVFFLFVYVLFHLNRPKASGASLYFLSERYPLRLAYNLEASSSPVKEFSFSLAPTDARKYKYLRLRMKGDKFSKLSGALKIQLANIRNEKDFYYLSGIGSKWQDFSIGLSEFKNISDYSNITSLSFIFEEWNLGARDGVLYIDNIRFSE